MSKPVMWNQQRDPFTRTALLSVRQPNHMLPPQARCALLNVANGALSRAFNRNEIIPDHGSKSSAEIVHGYEPPTEDAAWGMMSWSGTKVNRKKREQVGEDIDG